MGVLLNPSNPIKKAVKLALVVHTVAMFSIVTIPVGIDFDFCFSMDYINNREYSSNNEYAPGPLGYAYIIINGAMAPALKTLFPLYQWLTDGLLLRRCYVIYSMNHWVMAFPCLMYFATVAMGIMHVYGRWGTLRESTTSIDCTVSYYSISLGLNVLLTLMIVTRLIWHRRNLRAVLGASDGSSSLCTAIAAMIIESYALYAVTILAYTIPWAIGSWAAEIFSKTAGTMQVIAPYLIILRVAKRRAVTSESISGSFESMQFRSEGSVALVGSPSRRDPSPFIEVNGEGPGELGARDENAIEEVPL